MPPSDDDLARQAAELAASTQANAAAAANVTQPQPQTRYLVPGIDSFLGHGYDFFGEHASPNSVKGRIYALTSEPRIDQPTVDQSIPLTAEQISRAFIAPPTELRLIYSRPEKVGYTHTFQSSIEVNEFDYTHKSDTSWGVGGTLEGGYGGFSGEIKGRFDTQTTKLATAKCLQAVFETIYWKLDLNNYTYESPAPILPEVKQDFAKRTVDELMAKYGTHCLEEIGIGTKIVHSYTIDTSKFSTKIDVTAALKAKYQSGSFHAGLNVEGEYHDAAWDDHSAVKVKIYTYGTSDNQLEEITDLSKGLGQHPMNVLKQGWHNPTLIKFYPSSLTPLWKVEGLMTPDKAQAFEARFKERAMAAQGELANLFQGLQPVYLLSKSEGDKKRYRLEKVPRYTVQPGWTVENDGNVWLHLCAEDVAKKKRPDLVPLYELALNNNPGVVRYETDFWFRLLSGHDALYKAFEIDGARWSKTGKILGYVYEYNRPEQPTPDGGVPVYAFYDRDGLTSRGVFYSFLRELVWDNGQWRAGYEMQIVEREINQEVRDKIDREWDSHDGAYKFFHVKPGYPDIHIGAQGRAEGDPEPPPGSFFVWTIGIPHWFALRYA
jgi:hypothetical protein